MAVYNDNLKLIEESKLFARSHTAEPDILDASSKAIKQAVENGNALFRNLTHKLAVGIHDEILGIDAEHAGVMRSRLDPTSAPQDTLAPTARMASRAKIVTADAEGSQSAPGGRPKFVPGGKKPGAPGNNFG